MTGPALLRLHGYPVSNYVNVARSALLEKRLEHELVITGAGKDAGFLSMNPMGKIPVLETPGGCIAETVAIVEYLDDIYPQPSLRPADPLLRARGRQIVNVVQSYLEAPIRSLFPGVFFGGPANSAEVVETARAMLDRVTAALGALARPAPFLLGDCLSQADLALFYHLDIADRVTRFVWRRSIRDEIGTLDDWDAGIRTRPSTIAVLSDFETYFAKYLRDKQAAYRAADPAAVDILTHA
jgi:glutathione S-transferase